MSDRLHVCRGLRLVRYWALMCVPALPVWLPAWLPSRSGLLLSVRPKRSEDRAAISGIARDAFPSPGRHVGPPCDIAGRLGKLRASFALAGGEEDGKWDVLGLNFPTSDITTSGHVCGVIYNIFLCCPSKR